MKRILTLSLLACTLPLLPAAGDDGADYHYLYFLVSSYSTEGTKYNFDYARVGVAKNVDGDWTATWGAGDTQVYLPILLSNVGGEKTWGQIAEAGDPDPFTQAGPSYANFDVITDYDDADLYTFYVETYDSEDKLIWGYDETTAQSYNQLLAANHVAVSDHSAQTVTAWVVPEPSSGLLLLLGLAGLGLRRKRAGARFKV